MRPTYSPRQAGAASGLRTSLVVFTRTHFRFLMAAAGGDLSIKLWRNFRQLSAPLLARALTCISLSLLAFSLPGGPLALPAGGEPGSRFLRGGLQMCRLLEQLGLSYPG